MAITRRTDYAVRLMYELALLPSGASLSLRDLCEAADIPESFGQSLATFLVEGGLIRTSGVTDHQLSLARPAAQIPMAWIICACEPEFSLAQCVREPQSCPRSPHCGAHVLWVQLDQVIWNHLRSTTLADIASGMPTASEVYRTLVPHPCEQWPDDMR